MIGIRHCVSLSLVSHNWFKWEFYQLPVEMVCVLQYWVQKLRKSGYAKTGRLLALDGPFHKTEKKALDIRLLQTPELMWNFTKVYLLSSLRYNLLFYPVLCRHELLYLQLCPNTRTTHSCHRNIKQHLTIRTLKIEKNALYIKHFFL